MPGQGKTMKKLSALLLVLLPLISVAEPELKGSPNELRQFLQPQVNTVTIHGEAEEKAYSDTAIVSLVITTEKDHLSDAIAANTELRNSIAKKLSAAGIASENINSSKFSTSPQYGWFGKKPSSYKVVNRMAVEISKEDHLQALASVADGSADIELADIAFEHSQQEAFEQEVKQEALEDVMKQKSFYESNLGVKLVAVGFRDSSVGRHPTPGALAVEEVVVTGLKSPEPSSYDDGGAARTPSFDEVEYKARVSVDFRVEAQSQ